MAQAPTVKPYNALDNASSQALVNESAEGGLDVVCNISGTFGWGPSENFSLDEFERIMQINTTSVFAICQAALPHLEKTKARLSIRPRLRHYRALLIRLHIQHPNTLSPQSPKALPWNMAQKACALMRFARSRGHTYGSPNTGKYPRWRY